MPTRTMLSSFNPATGESVGEVAIADPLDVPRSVEAARVAQPSWWALGAGGRARHLRAWEVALQEHAGELARLVSLETGKPLGEALSEVFAAAEFLAYNARHARRWLADQPIQDFNPLLRNPRTVLRHAPKGVVAVISPWNFPLLLAMASISAALAAGNAVLHKPSEFTPLIAQRVAELALAAGLPAGIFQVLQGAGPVGAALSESAVDHVCFTGSVATGRRVAASCAARLSTTTLELGGNDPALVLESADLDFTAQGLVFGAFVNAGQVCASIERVYVLRPQAPALIEKVLARARALRVGSGLEPGAEVGPIIHEAQLAKIDAQVRDAVAMGATILLGAQRLSGPGTFYAPTVVTDVRPEMALMREETFGPVLPIQVVDSLEEMIALANMSPYGLSATVWGRDLEAAEHVARRLEAGTVWVNTGLDSYANPLMPRSGWKHSGLGRVGGHEGFMELTRSQLVDVNRSGRPRLGWFPASRGFYPFLLGALDALHAASLGRRASGLWRMLRHWGER